MRLLRGQIVSMLYLLLRPRSQCHHSIIPVFFLHIIPTQDNTLHVIHGIRILKRLAYPTALGADPFTEPTNGGPRGWYLGRRQQRPYSSFVAFERVSIASGLRPIEFMESGIRHLKLWRQLNVIGTRPQLKPLDLGVNQPLAYDLLCSFACLGHCYVG
jgi:hypothetical protein